MRGFRPSNPSEPPLVFVYLGRELPEYSLASLRFASRGHSGDVLLLTNSHHRLPEDSTFRVENIHEWYDGSRFQSFREKTTLDIHFRSGFWLHVVERFFVLQQYMEINQLERLFHAELDVMVFDLSGVSEACDRHGSGIFAVMDDHSRALASLFYVNEPEKFDQFLSFAVAQTDMRNEMEMIGSFLQQFPDSGHSLPSDRFFDRSAHPLSPSAVDDRLGLFDANAFGQWLFGLDPKNVKLTVRNHFWNPMATFSIDCLRFRCGLFGRKLIARMPGGEKRQVRTLHVHSKIVSRLTFRPVLIFYLWVNNLPLRWVVLRKSGWVESRMLDIVFRGRPILILRVLHRLAPQWIQGALLRAVSRAAVPLSIRQRELLLQLLQIPEPVAPPLERIPTVVIDPDSVLEPRSRIGRNLELSSGPAPQMAGSTSLSQTQSAGLGEGLCQILESRAEELLVRAPEVGALPVPSADETGRCPLFVTAEKFDSDWPHVISRWGESLDCSLSFSPKCQLIRPAWVREMFPSGRRDLHEWLQSSEAVSWQTFVQAYGAWARTHHPGSIFLAPEKQEKK